MFGKPTHVCPNCRARVTINVPEFEPKCFTCESTLLSVTVTPELAHELDKAVPTQATVEAAQALRGLAAAR